MTNSNTLLPTSAQPDAEGFRRYRIAPSGIGSAGQSNSVTSEYGSDSNTIFDDDRLPGSNLVRPITVGGKQYKYVQWGYDDQLPYRLRREIMSNMITAQCQQFNIVSCYGQGVRFVDRKTKQDVSEPDILHLKQLEKEEMKNPRVSRRKEILKIRAATAAAAKSLQLCPTLYNPMDCTWQAPLTFIK